MPDRQKNQYILLKPKIPWHSVKEQIYFPIWLLTKKIKLVHFTYFSFPILCPKKYILTIHDLIPWHFATGRASTLPSSIYLLKQFFYKIILWVGSRRAYKIIAVSKATKNDIIKTLKINPNKIEVIYEGIDEKLSGKVQTTSLKNYLLYVGNAYPHKNLDNLVRGYALSCKENNNLNYPKLILVGPDDYFYKVLKAKVKELKLEEFVIFAGRAADSQLSFLYKNAKCFVSASLSEGFGLPGLEAMSFGCPVICSNIAVFKEIYAAVPRFFNPNSIEDIHKAITWAVNLPEDKRRQLGELGKIRSKYFSWEECARKTLKVYESCYSL